MDATVSQVMSLPVRMGTASCGGYSTHEMKNRLGVPEKRPLADFLPMVTITAMNLATEITNFNVAKEDLHGEEPITAEHVLNNQDVRDLLVKRGIVPEDLPAEEDLKRLERRARTAEKQIAKKSGLPSGYEE